MRRFFCFFLITCTAISGTVAQVPKHDIRPITLAKGVLAVWYSDWGLGSPNPGPHLIFAAWPDGRVVWSSDRLKGGAPYREGQVDPARVTSLLKRFQSDGLYSDEIHKQSQFPIDSAFVTILIRYGNQKAELQSAHELEENHDWIAAQQKKAPVLRENRRMNGLRKLPPDQLLFRFVWADARLRMADLLPTDSTISQGSPVMKAGILSWQDEAPGDIPGGIRK